MYPSSKKLKAKNIPQPITGQVVLVSNIAQRIVVEGRPSGTRYDVTPNGTIVVEKEDLEYLLGLEYNIKGCCGAVPLKMKIFRQN